jgi:hypothetical protein
VTPAAIAGGAFCLYVREALVVFVITRRAFLICIAQYKFHLYSNFLKRFTTYFAAFPCVCCHCHQKREAIRRRDHGEETLAEIGRSYNVSGWTIARLEKC